MQQDQPLQPVKPENCRIANAASGTFRPFLTNEGEPDGEVLPANATGALPKSMMWTRRKWRRIFGNNRLSEAVQGVEGQDGIKRMHVAA